MDTSKVENKIFDTAKVIVEQFRLLREAFYQKSVAAIYDFFNLPIILKAADLLNYLINEGKEKNMVTIINDKNFAKMASSFLTNIDIKLMLKVKTKQLEAEKYYETEDTLVHNLRLVKLIVEIKNDELELNFQTNNLGYENNEIIHHGESSSIYTFKLDKNKKLKFHNFFIAG